MVCCGKFYYRVLYPYRKFAASVKPDAHEETADLYIQVQNEVKLSLVAWISARTCKLNNILTGRIKAAT